MLACSPSISLRANGQALRFPPPRASGQALRFPSGQAQYERTSSMLGSWQRSVLDTGLRRYNERGRGWSEGTGLK